MKNPRKVHINNFSWDFIRDCLYEYKLIINTKNTTYNIVERISLFWYFSNCDVTLNDLRFTNEIGSLNMSFKLKSYAIYIYLYRFV